MTLTKTTKRLMHRQTSVIDAVRLMWPAVDIGAILLSWVMVSGLLDYQLGPWRTIVMLLSGVALRVVLLWSLGQYRSVFRYCGLHALGSIAAAVFSGTLTMGICWALTDMPSLTFVIFEGLVSFLFCGGNRILVRALYEWRTRSQGQRVLIYGAGSLGETTLRTLRRSESFNPVGFIDDSPRLRKSVIHGRKVLGGFAELAQVCADLKPAMVVLAIRDFPAHKVKTLFAECMRLGLRVKKITGLDHHLDGVADLSVDDIAIDDLLRRPARNLDPGALPAMLDDQVVLVTGAGGSIGTELCRQVARHKLKKLLLIDHSEAALFQVEMELRDLRPDLAIEAVLLNLANQAPLEALFARTRPDIIFHAAAYKHVPLVEANPIIGVRNNVGGFYALLSAAVAAEVGRVVLISTDKAVRPTNVMGASKRTCELLLQNYPAGKTKLCAVRFGNVLGSSGSVVPRFLDQIAHGGPVTVTDPRMTRYFMLIPEAVELVLHAGALADHGEIFILDMGDPVKIDDMARQLIHLTGHVPGKDIHIVYTGLRPGEKLYEELLISDAERKTSVEGITVAQAGAQKWDYVKAHIADLLLACETQDQAAMVRALAELVDEWRPSEGLRALVDTTRRYRRGSASGRTSAVH